MQAGNGVETNTQGVQWESNKQLFINCLLLSSGKQSAIQLAMTLVVILAIFIIIGFFLPFVSQPPSTFLRDKETSRG